MSKPNPFQKNLDHFAALNPKHAIAAAQVEPEEPPGYEASLWFHPLSSLRGEILYVFGIDAGQAYQEAKPWLQQNSNRHLVFLEDNLRRIHHFLKQESSEEFFLNRQAHLFAFSEISEKDSVFNLLAWSFIQQQIFFSPLPFYRENRAEESGQLEQLLLYESTQKNEIVDEYMKFGIVYYRNFYRNLRLLHHSYHGNKLFGKFQGVPAIICGAGPSLKKNLHLLEDLKNKALIFAGGSALNALCKGNIHPHFGAGIDPNPTQYYRMMGHTAKNVPFFYRPRMHYEAFRSLKGPPLYINGAGGYDTAEWIEKELGIEGKIIDEGFNVVNFCTSLAKELGCNPLIFIGMDLAYTDLKSYAEGVIADPDVTEDQIVQTDLFETSAVLRKDIFGRQVYTMWKWIAEADWLSDFSEKCPEITIVNATEGGLGFQGIDNMSLKEAASRYLKKSFDLEELIKASIEQARLTTVTEDNVTGAINTLKESLSRCIDMFDTLIEEGNRVQKKVEKGENAHSLQTGLQALTETELMEEPAYEAVLEIFSTMFAHIKQRDFNSLKLEEDFRKRNIRLLELTDEKYLFLRQTAEANLILIHEALT